MKTTAFDVNFKKGNYSRIYTEVPTSDPGHAWREGMVSGNGENGYITSGSPYADSFIFQNIWFNYPSNDPRNIPEELTGQLAEARWNVFKQNSDWIIPSANGLPRKRTFYYCYHPGHQLRLTKNKTSNVSEYKRWTNYETAETGVSYTNADGQWERISFTSREDNVSITKIGMSSTGKKINMTISIDDISGMYGAENGKSDVTALKYKKLVSPDADYIGQVAHYPSYSGSELAQGGFAGLTQVIVVNGIKKKVLLSGSNELIHVGKEENPAIQILDAEAVYLITQCDRTFNMGDYEQFEGQTRYDLVDQIYNHTRLVANKYKNNQGCFDYGSALAPHALKHAREFNAVSFNLEGGVDQNFTDNESLILAQKATPNRINHALMEQIYNQGRYAMICCSGSSAPRLCGMWTGEWNPKWRAIYTLDANVNLQVASMNTGNLTQAQMGYITFFLRNIPDFARNASMAYSMHDAIQVSVNSDGDRGMHVEYDNSYPFQYWNAGASWCLLPMFEYWQCYGNQHIAFQERMNLKSLQPYLSTRDGGLTDDEFAELLQKGYLDLEKDILLPLLTKQANFWEQICTPEYYTDEKGNACYQQGKQVLQSGETYLIIPTYSPENHPIGYTSTLTANATMDIAAARDGLQMTIALEKAVKREGYEEAIQKWEALLSQLPEYQCDTDGALREWAMKEYTEKNNHRHLSHLYVAWPAYDTQHNKKLKEAAKIAIVNRDHFNKDDSTAGHGWMHKALVYARLKNGDGVVSSLLPMMTNEGYYTSLLTDHDTNRKWPTFCTDTSFGNVAAVNEALLFSNTGEIEVLPALPSTWTVGSVNGLIARTRTEVKKLSWNIADKEITVILNSKIKNNVIRLKAGIPWIAATVDGKEEQVYTDEIGSYLNMELEANHDVTVVFTLSYNSYSGGER